MYKQVGPASLPTTDDVQGCQGFQWVGRGFGVWGIKVDDATKVQRSFRNKSSNKTDATLTLLTVTIDLTLVKKESESVLLDVFGGFQHVKLLTGWNHRYHVSGSYISCMHYTHVLTTHGLQSQLETISI